MRSGTAISDGVYYPFLLRGVARHESQPGMGDGHLLHPDGSCLRLRGGRTRLVLATGTVVADVDHDGSGVMRPNAGGLAGHVS